MSVLDNQVIRQCLSFLPLQDFVAPILDYRKQLSTVNVLKINITAQLLKCTSLDCIEKLIRSDKGLQTEFGLSSVCKSTLSRRVNDLPVEIPQALFHAVVHRIQSHSKIDKDMQAPLPLAIVDSTNIRLPFNLADWTNVTQQRSGIKVHTRLMVIDKKVPYPDKIVPSTGNVSDYEGSDLLVVDQGVLYVMDRGYVCYKRMERWVGNNIEFVVRVNVHHHAEILEEHTILETDPHIQRDATVIMGKNKNTTMKSKLRLIEFQDEQGRFYRLTTTRWDLSAKEVTDIYRQRWLIELFFKWLKQHLKFAQLYSHQPNAVWNHIFFALITYGLSYLVTLQTQTTKTIWDTLVLIRIYALKKWSDFTQELYRKPSKPSKGRQKKEKPPPKRAASSDVALIKVKKGKKQKTEN